MTQKTYKFKEGERYALDTIYRLQGIIPNDSYHQDDIADSRILNDNDSGETVLFLNDVTIKIVITVKEPKKIGE